MKLSKVFAIAAITLATVAAVSLRAQSPEWRHGLSLLGTPRYPADFKRFNYVNPDAPKGGLVRLGQFECGGLGAPEVGEIRRIEFGMHMPGGLGEQINTSIKLLGSEVFRDRDGASKDLLQAGHWACPSLQKACKSTDAETAQLAELLDKLQAGLGSTTSGREGHDG